MIGLVFFFEFTFAGLFLSEMFTLRPDLKIPPFYYIVKYIFSGVPDAGDSQTQISFMNNPARQILRGGLL